MNLLRKAISTLEIEEIYNDRQETKKWLTDHIEVGSEFSDLEGQRYGVFLKEMSGTKPYRIQWYDPEGLSGHIELESVEQAAEEFIMTLGPNLEPAPGSLDRLFLGWGN